ncbi:Ubiquitin-like domain superfamily [Arabidopsis suecica]|uniref:Ubiquitin-like domain superfamily n=1 Tax=Arabidopsis suecica TaxID=45249 RepID=A0A8T2E8E5_ARASU|nr:Ubiquitin-like domain superfamily [Arabidopsis suecica]
MNVYIDTETGSSFSITIDFGETVLEIKEKIEKSQGIPVSKQILYLDGKALEDDLHKIDYMILFESRLLLRISPDANPNQSNEQTEQSKQIDDKKQEFCGIQDSSESKKLTRVMARRVHNVYSSLPAYSLDELLGPKYSATVTVGGRTNQVVQTTEQASTSGTAKEVLRDSDSPVEKKIKTNPMKFTVHVKPYQEDTKMIQVEVNADDNVEELRKELVKMQERGELNLPHEAFHLLGLGSSETCPHQNRSEEPNQCPTILMSPHGLQAIVT